MATSSYLMITAAAYLLIFHGGRWVASLAAAVIIGYVVAVFQARTLYLTLIAVFGLLLWYRPRLMPNVALIGVDGETFGLPVSAVPTLQILARQCQALSGQIAGLERELRQRSLQDEATRRLLQVPGIGAITATALSATVVDPTSFKSAREFAAWIGLVPRQHSSGGHERLGGITKMGHATCADC